MTGAMFRGAADFGARMLARAGYTVVPNWRLENLAFAHHLRGLLTRFDIDCVLDVGANEGGFGTFLRNEVGFKGTIFSFEPVSSVAAVCREAARNDPSWHVLNHALGSETATSEIKVMAYSQLSSFLEPINTTAPVYQDKNVVARTEAVQIRRLDEIWPDLQGQYQVRRPYLKVDTQGFDLAVFEGAGDLLDSIRAIQTELSVRPIYQNMPNWQHVLGVLEARQFSISNMFAVGHDPAFRAIEFDCVMVNDRFAAD